MSGHSYYSVAGCPRPVGSEFRQRVIWGERRRSKGTTVPWVISLVDTLAGPVIEARNHLDPDAEVVSDPARLSLLSDVLIEARGLIDTDEGWTAHTVQQCTVRGCLNPLPMWRHHAQHRGHGPLECLPCSLRTVLACVECGAPDDASTVGRERLLAESLCFGCALWRDRLLEPDRVVSQRWHVMSIASVGIGHGGVKAHKGFGGAEWVITFTDGRVVETDDLWDGGEIPEWFRDRFVQNAEVRSAASVREEAS